MSNGFQVNRRWVWVSAAFLVGVAFHSGSATANPRAVMSIGEVVGNNVYVRSGASENHYVICKLNAGSRVTVVGDQGDWLEILPPDEVFSLIAGEYVDTVDKKNGVVNADRVNVRAGSLINDNKYTVQTKLAKGAEVRIVGENADGFLRIAPPSGATVWITRQYVEMVPDPGLTVPFDEPIATSAEPTGADTRSGNEVGTKATQTHTPATATTTATPSPAPAIELDPHMLSPFYMMEATPQRVRIETIDAALQAEFEKPLLQRDLDPIVAQYREIANQQEDEVAKRYAAGRLDQLENMAAIRSAVRKLRELDGEAESVRRRFLDQRAELMEPRPGPPVALDAQGELRASAVFQGRAGPRRFRLVDPKVGNGRTIGFVEIPLDATYDVNDYLGRYIGVRAASTKMLADAVNPMPVYIASELVVLESTERSSNQESGRP